MGTYLGDCLQEPIIFCIAHSLGIHGGHHNHMVSNVRSPGFKDTNFDIWILSETCCHDQASRSPSHYNEVIFMGEKLLKRAKCGKIRCNHCLRDSWLKMMEVQSRKKRFVVGRLMNF